MLQVENISFSYRKGRKEVLSDFSLSLEAGRVSGLLGKNGAGKSTLLYLMRDVYKRQDFYVREERAGTSNDSRLCIRD